MSEYQYYEFQAIDRPLTAEEQEQVGRLSSRTHPTPTALAEHRGELIPFKERIRRIHEKYSNRPALRTRLKQAGLLQDRK